VLSKLHHCVVDGVSGTDLYRLVLDPTPTPRPPVPDTWEPAAAPSTVATTTRAMWELATSPLTTVRAVARSLTAPRQLARTTSETATGLLAMASAVRPVRPSSLTGPLEGSRRYAWTDISLDDIRVVRERCGATVNDVALAVVSGGFRRLLVSRGEEPDAHALRSLVPVSTREPGAEHVLDNRVSLMLPYLPVDVADPVERLRAVHERIGGLRDHHEPEAGGSVTAAAELAPYPPVSWGIRLGFRLPQRQVATVTTNVPGPRTTLYALGREALAMLPYVPIADRVRVGVAMFSYRDTLTFGLTGDYDTVPDLQVLADGISSSMAELLAAVGQDA
jgi:diacylglycerol O-acyltransferase